MRKNIKEFRQGDLIELGQCSWVPVVVDAFRETNGLVYLRVRLLGLMHTQVLVFNEGENFEFEFEEGVD